MARRFWQLVLVTATGPQLALAGDVDFDREIRPILVANCYPCHGPHDETREAGLRFDREEIATAPLKSGNHAIARGDPQESELMRRIVSADPDYRMPPPDHAALTPAQVALLGEWIVQGAHFTPPWALTAITKTETPAVRDRAWCEGEIDARVLATREAAGLKAPASDLSATSLLRKLSFDLRGMPPAPAEVAEFERDPSKSSFSKMVDKYLADPAFGERWGRHWLDLARYAETLGHEFDYEMPDAWRYRDYVIEALNADIPIDRFIAEQVAGDLISPRAALGLPNVAPIATGWWFLGPAVHAPVDVRQDEADRMAGCVDVIGKSILGMSVACARCHDHKFDPIPARDFYALLGVARNTRRVNAFVPTDAHAGGHLAEAIAAMDSVGRAMPLRPAPLLRQHSQGSTPIDDLIDQGATWRRSGDAFACSVGSAKRDQGGSVIPGEVGTIDSARLSPQLVGSARSQTHTIGHRYLHVRLRGSDASIRANIDNYWLNERNDLLFEGMLRRLPVEDAGDAWRVETFDLVRFKGERLYLELTDEGGGFIEVDWIASSDSAAPPDNSQWDVDGPAELPSDPGDTQAVKDALAKAQAAVEALIKCSAPIRALVAEEASALDEAVHLRGAAHAPGDLVPRATLSLLKQARPVDGQSSGRLELAQQLTDPANPYLWRTTANRVWLKLFGRGIVETPDDFGQLGTAPWSAELLDALAAQLVTERSLKRLIRSIVLSHAYRASGTSEPHGPWWSPLPVRRLDAESIRDAMLCASGRIDRTPGGQSVPAHLSPYMQGRGRPEKSGPIDGDGRRSVYLAVRRNFLDPFMQAFDAPVPSTTCGRRHSSNVPAQSLALLNSELVHALADLWGERVAQSTSSDTQRIAQMWAWAYSRSPTAQEAQSAGEFLAQERMAAPESMDAGLRERTAFAALAQVLFASKEFVFLQ